MKKFFLIIIAVVSMFEAFLSAEAFAQAGAPASQSLTTGRQNKKNDTLKIKWNGSRIWIFDAEVKPASDSARKHEPSSKNEFVHWAGVDLGICTLSTFDNKLKLSDEADTTQMNTFLDLNYGKSWFLSLNVLQKNIPLYKNYVNIVTGLGIEWNSYNFRKNITLNPDAPYISAANSSSAPDSVKYLKNKLKATYLKAPLLLEFNTNTKNPDKSFHIAGGVEVAYKIGSKTKQKYEMNGYEFNVKQKDDYHLANIKYSSVLRVGYGDYFTVFANYSISQLFEKNKGPQVFPFTTGVSINF